MFSPEHHSRFRPNYDIDWGWEFPREQTSGAGSAVNSAVRNRRERSSRAKSVLASLTVSPQQHGSLFIELAAAIVSRSGEIRAIPDFDIPNLWLTFYLCSASTKLAKMAVCLGSIGAVNLDGAEGGFLDPKLPTKNEPSAMVARVEQVLKLASVCDVRVLGVDVDTSADIGSSLFWELIRF